MGVVSEDKPNSDIDFDTLRGCCQVNGVNPNKSALVDSVHASCGRSCPRLIGPNSKQAQNSKQAKRFAADEMTLVA